MDRPSYNPWLHRYALIAALATLALLGVGGLVTSHGVGMAVPDWPTTYGYNMFFFPLSQWVGGIFYEHTHRLVATVVGILVVGLTRWLGGKPSRLPLAIVGISESLIGLWLLRIGPQWQGAGHFLAGIGGVVLLAASVWTQHEPAVAPLRLCGWLAFGLVQFQGLLGGLRVILYSDELGIFHGILAQLFFVLMCAIALLTSQRWRATPNAQALDRRADDLADTRVGSTRPGERPTGPKGRWLGVWFFVASLLILAQLALGATMRHQHAGLAIPDFPLAYGRIWPSTDSRSVNRYNQQRMEITALNPITSRQIELQMLHRLLALLILGAVMFAALATRRVLGRQNFLSKMTLGWLGLILLQVLLGAATIWSNKAADLATAHVLVGALSLALGAITCIIASRHLMVYPGPGAPCHGWGTIPLGSQPATPRAS